MPLVMSSFICIFPCTTWRLLEMCDGLYLTNVIFSILCYRPTSKLD